MGDNDYKPSAADIERGYKRIKAVSDSHKWDGPLTWIEWVQVPTCSICGDDAATDRLCPGPKETEPTNG